MKDFSELKLPQQIPSKERISEIKDIAMFLNLDPDMYYTNVVFIDDGGKYPDTNPFRAM